MVHPSRHPDLVRALGLVFGNMLPRMEAVDIREAILQAIKRKGLTNNAFSKKVTGVSDRTVRAFLNEGKQLGWDKLGKVLDALGLTIVPAKSVPLSGQSDDESKRLQELASIIGADKLEVLAGRLAKRQSRTKSEPTTEFAVDMRVVEILSEQLEVHQTELTRETTFIEDLNVDSLDVVNLIMEFEAEFDIEIDDEEADRLRTVGQLIDYLKMMTGQF